LAFDTSSERRRAERIGAELRVEFKHLGRPGETFADLSSNISAGGVFVETSVGIELGMQVELEISPGPGAKPIRMVGEVVRVEEEAAVTGSRRTGRCRGMALRFLDADAGELARLLSLAKQMEEKGAGG
jgi:uncharacterized protein (TIGR02266 family)